ncbi:MAG: thioredoxin family protein [bacterium]
MVLEKFGMPLTLILTLTIALGLAGCGKKGESEKKETAKPIESPAEQVRSGAEADSNTDGLIAQNVIQSESKADLKDLSSSAEDQTPKPTLPKTATKESPKKLPKMVDLGRDTCVPCKMMAPILEELKKEYEGKAMIEVIDLRHDMDAARRYRIRVIPTQIFFDAEGNEVWRHEGYMPKQQIVAKLAELGVEPPK